MLEQISVCLTSLYLRGLPRPTTLTRRRWAKVVSCLRIADCSIDLVPATLRASGFWEEAVCLESDGLVEMAARLVSSGSVLTAVDAAYPQSWIKRLGDGAPPALWVRGSIPIGSFVGIVGSRQIDPEVYEFAFQIGCEAARLGYAIVSGGAAGCDYAGAAGAVSARGAAIEVLPNGIDHYARTDRCGVSVCAPDEIFSRASAMERNALIYAAAEATVVVHARFKSGGTWIGAVEATRKHICPLLVRDDAGQASRALIALGGLAISRAEDLGPSLAHIPPQGGLFDAG